MVLELSHGGLLVTCRSSVNKSAVQEPVPGVLVFRPKRIKPNLGRMRCRGPGMSVVQGSQSCMVKYPGNVVR